MSHYAGYMEDEYEMEDVDDDMDDEFRGRELAGSESDVDELDYAVSAFMFYVIYAHNDNFKNLAIYIYILLVCTI